MKQILLMIVVVALAGCGSGTPDLTANPKLEKAIRKHLAETRGVMPTGKLTKEDFDKVTRLSLTAAGLGDEGLKAPAVGRARRGSAEIEPVDRNILPLHPHAIGIVFALGRRERSVFVADAHPIPLEKSEIFPGAVQAKGCVQLAAREGSILAGGEHYDKLPGLENQRGKPPMRKDGKIVGEIPAREVDRIRSAVVELDPVGIISIFIRQRAVVVRHEFRDDDIGPQRSLDHDKDSEQ